MTVNRLQLATSRHIELPVQELPVSFMEKAIKNCYALEKITVPNTSSAKSQFALYLPQPRESRIHRNNGAR